MKLRARLTRVSRNAAGRVTRAPAWPSALPQVWSAMTFSRPSRPAVKPRPEAPWTPVALRDTLVNRARSFIYTTAPPPLAALAVRFALEVVRDEPERRARLHALVARARAAFGRDIPGSTQILPLILGTNAAAMAAAEKLQAQGFDVRAVRAPTVPEGTARLRLSITLNATPADVDRLGRALADLAGPGA